MPLVDMAAMANSLHTEVDDVMIVLFSDANVKRLQRSIQLAVKATTGEVVDAQSVRELSLIMRYAYLQRIPSKGLTLDDQIDRIDSQVMCIAVPQVTSGVLQQLAYIRDASTLPAPPDRGINDSVAGNNSTSLFSGFGDAVSSQNNVR